jgi:hypothetical protein
VLLPNGNQCDESSAKFNQLSTKELFIRFVVGGTVVSFFAVLGDLLKPKSFAGLLGAAPSVALANENRPGSLSSRKN